MKKLNNIEPVGLAYLLDKNMSIFINTTSAGILSSFTNTSGAAAILVGGALNYATSLSDKIITGGKYVSADAAFELANDAYVHAYRHGNKKPFGVGVTASMYKPDQRPGRFVGAQICIRDDQEFYLKLLTVSESDLTKGRIEVDRMITDTVVNILASWSNTVQNRVDKVEPGFVSANPTTRRLIDSDELWRSNYYKFIFPVTGNPLHWAHILGFKWATERLGPGLFQFTLNHPLKGRAPDENVLKLINACTGFGDLVIDEDMGLYVDKAKFYGKSIVMGDDALQTYMKMSGELSATSIGAKIYVLNRGSMTAEEVVYHGATPLMNPRWDISSSQLRSR
jgi:hypothetical protein